ncbi:hypothetical protein V6N13_049755 [Hibiscus sabdariffa]
MVSRYEVLSILFRGFIGNSILKTIKEVEQLLDLYLKPRLVSIGPGPFHRDEDLPLDKYKYLFLDKFMFRTGKDLSFYVQAMMALQWRTRRCYSEDLSMSDPEFIEMISPVQSQSSSSERVQLEQQCDPPVHLIRSVTELRTSDIQFWPRRANRFTDINFKAGVLEFPPVTINDHFIAILINCMAFEHCSVRSSKDLTAYVSFMSSLIRHPTDSKSLCSNGIVSTFSNNDKTITDSFHLISRYISNLDIQDSYLSGTLKATESYYTRIGRTWRWRRFVMRYSGISLFCIANLLFAFYRLRPVVFLMIHFVKENFLGDDIENTCVGAPSQRHRSLVSYSVFIIVKLNRTIATYFGFRDLIHVVVSLVLASYSNVWLPLLLNGTKLMLNDLILSCILYCEKAMNVRRKIGRKFRDAKLLQNLSDENPENAMEEISGSCKSDKDSSANN